MLNGWFFIEGSVGGWLRDLLKGSKHSQLLNGLKIHASAKGKCIAWCPEPMTPDKLPLFSPPVGQCVHVPYHAKKAVQGLFVDTTVQFLTDKLGEKLGEPKLAVENEASGSGGNTAADKAVVALEVQDDDGEEEEAQPARKRGRWEQQQEYKQPDLDHRLFHDGKYRGKYSDAGEGAGTLNQFKHLLRAYCASDWDECDQLVRRYSEKHALLVFYKDSLNVRTLRDR
jgi:hypothetical protein